MLNILPQFLFIDSTQGLIIFWISLVVLAIIIEAATYEIISIWFALGAFFTMIFSFFVTNFNIQIVFFFIVSLLSVFLLRPKTLMKLKKNNTKFNIHAIVGKLGVVTKDITPLEKGEVKQGAQIWMAKSVDDETLTKDTTIEVVEVKGATLVVKKHEKGEQN